MSCNQRLILAAALQIILISVSSIHTCALQVGCNSSNRRNFIHNLASKGVVGASSILIATNGYVVPACATEEQSPKVIRSAGCARGSGEACEDLAEGNEFILNLQRKSQESATRGDRDALAAYNNKNFPDYMASLNPPRYLVKQPDGKFAIYDGQELGKLKQMGKIRVERPMAKGGKYADLTQKPILVQIE